MTDQDGTYVVTGDGIEFLPGVHLNSGWSTPKKRGEMTAAEISKWWSLRDDEPARRAAILEVTSNEETWDAYSLPVEDPFFDRWRNVTEKGVRKRAIKFFKRHFFGEE